MNKNEVRQGFQHLNQLAQEEYGTDLARAVDVREEELRVRRIARLTGIELKRPFSTPHDLQGSSKTGAKREWLFNHDLLKADSSGVIALEKLREHPSYKTELQVYEELKKLRDSGPATVNFNLADFGSFLKDSHNESNWFLAALLAVRPYLCEKSNKRSAPTTSEARDHFWECVRDAAGEVAGRGLERALEPVAIALCGMVPFLKSAHPAVAVGMSVFLLHYARRGFCEVDIETEIVTTLKWRDNDWEKR